MKLSKISWAVVLLAACSVGEASDRQYVVKPRAGDRSSLPFSEGVLVGNTLYIAGHIGLDAKTNMPPASAEEEARFVMEEIKQTVEAAGLTMDEVVLMQVYCTDLKLYDLFNAVYRTYFQGKFPARAFLGIDKLLRNGRYEVMGIAIKKEQ